ncbi:MAG: hypothetical protein J6Y78_14265 [Paludibacteraceae bacterium]|nr:hypothetical protein [Paludibacteraceae bacterium]
MRRFLFYILPIFILFPYNGLAQKQSTNQETKRFEVLGDSGSFNFQIGEIIKEEKVIQKHFTNIIYIKKTNRNTLLLKQKNAIKASIRICVDQGELPSYQGSSLTPSNERCRIYTDSLYSEPMRIRSFKVKGIAKEERSVKVTIYDNITNACLGEKTFRLSPVIVHKHTPEIRYTDVDGNNQIYTNETRCWIPASTTSPAYFIVRDEYGKQMENVSYVIHSIGEMGGTLQEKYITDTIPVEILKDFNQQRCDQTGKVFTRRYINAYLGRATTPIIEVLEIRK